MAAGRISNRALLQAASRLLDIEGVKQFPAELDLSDVKVVFNLAPFAPAELFTLVSSSASGPLPFAGSSFIGYDIISGDPTDEPFIQNTNFDCWVQALELVVNYDAAGALADNGQTLSLKISRRSAVGDVITPIIDIRNFAQVATGTLTYSFNLGMYSQAVGGTPLQLAYPIMRDNYVPKGEGLYFLVSRASGVFPANTNITFTLNVHTRTREYNGEFAWFPPS